MSDVAQLSWTASSLVVGLVCSTLLSLSLTGTLGVVTASVTNKGATAGLAPETSLRLESTSPAATCTALQITDPTVQCPGIDLFGSQILLTAGATGTPREVWASKDGPDSLVSFDLTFDQCTNVSGGDPCNDSAVGVSVIVEYHVGAGWQPLANGSLSTLRGLASLVDPPAEGDILTRLNQQSPNNRVGFRFTPTIGNSAVNGMRVDQAVSWTAQVT